MAIGANGQLQMIGSEGERVWEMGDNGMVFLVGIPKPILALRVGQ